MDQEESKTGQKRQPHDRKTASTNKNLEVLSRRLPGNDYRQKLVDIDNHKARADIRGYEAAVFPKSAEAGL